jgi:hypothetical protein
MDDEFEQPECVMYYPDFVEWKLLENHNQERDVHPNLQRAFNIFLFGNGFGLPEDV